MNVNLYNTTDYENIIDWTPGENKPNSKPNKANLKRAKMNVNSLITKDYRKEDDFAVQKNKANSKPILKEPKMDVNIYSTKDYENEPRLRAPGKQTQFKPKQSQFRNPTAGRQNVLHNKVHTAFIVRKAKVVQKTVVLVERPMAIGYKIAKGKSKKQETRNTRYDKGDKI